MNSKNDSLKTVGDFLIRFYHEEPCDTIAATQALVSMRGVFRYELEVAHAFKNVLKCEKPEAIKNIVLKKANRYVKNSQEAKEFLERVYDDTNLENAIDFDDLT